MTFERLDRQITNHDCAFQAWSDRCGKGGLRSAVSVGDHDRHGSRFLQRGRPRHECRYRVRVQRLVDASGNGTHADYSDGRSGRGLATAFPRLMDVR